MKLARSWWGQPGTGCPPNWDPGWGVGGEDARSGRAPSPRLPIGGARTPHPAEIGEEQIPWRSLWLRSSLRTGGGRLPPSASQCHAGVGVSAGGVGRYCSGVTGGGGGKMWFGRWVRLVLADKAMPPAKQQGHLPAAKGSGRGSGSGAAPGHASASPYAGSWLRGHAGLGRGRNRNIFLS